MQFSVASVWLSYTRYITKIYKKQKKKQWKKPKIKQKDIRKSTEIKEMHKT